LESLPESRSLPSGKGYFTLGKEHSAKSSLPSIFFRTLGKDFAECQKALGKEKTLGTLRIEKIKKKQQNIFLNSRNKSPTLPIYLTRCPIIFHYYFESNLYVL
jgi:hypothetical protein